MSTIGSIGQHLQSKAICQELDVEIPSDWIRVLAYYIWLRNGCQLWQHLRDWVQAEDDLEELFANEILPHDPKLNFWGTIASLNFDDAMASFDRWTEKERVSFPDSIATIEQPGNGCPRDQMQSSIGREAVMNDIVFLTPEKRTDLIDLTPEQFATAFADAEYLFIRGGRQTVYAVSRTSREALKRAVQPAFDKGGAFAGEDPHEFGFILGPRLQAQAAKYLAKQNR